MAAAGVDMSNPNAWDDSFLIKSWNDAKKEYEKYHSIHKSGKRLEDALSEEELKELREDYGEYIGETHATPEAAQTIWVRDQEDSDMSYTETNGVGNIFQDDAQQAPKPTTHQESTESNPAGDEQSAPHEGALTSAMPQALLGSVQDENLKNIMMSWYYAGYYTGLHSGQQQAQKNLPPKQ